MSNTPIRLVQLIHPTHGRKVALVKEPFLVLLNETNSIYQLVLTTIYNRKKIEDQIDSFLSDETLNYDSIYDGGAEWKLLPSFDHPTNAYACLVSGTGLTHKNSALNRQAMHIDEKQKLTDSMQMYQWGLENGHPANGTIGVQPEWFYKGNGHMLVSHGDALEVPSYADDGGEEPEIAGVYLVDKNGDPLRIGFTTGNEFSDHIMEKKNYLYLAPSKLRTCAIGPELVINTDFNDIHGEVSIEREGNTIWSSDIKTGEKNMAHSLSNIEHHHFKYEAHRIPYQAHIHFFGADAFSFGNKIMLNDEDVMKIYWQGFGRPLKNVLKKSSNDQRLVAVRPMS